MEIYGRANKPAIIPIITFDPGQSPSHDSSSSQIFALIGPFFSDDYRHFLEPPPRPREDALSFR